ncbi:MAG TPA: NAD(P)/FAD-dependent oxidoreductase [Erysipelotrichaceae bacterium]|nr:NAD(P)/FAD-dependent oxidoreductase [Erysipelotrichaceae bacterium]
MQPKTYDVIIVGSGMAGLTSAAYLSKDNHKVLIIEKDEAFGGLLGAFNVKGHWVDKGARGIIDSGIITPMLKQLDMDIPFAKNPIKMTFKDASMDFLSVSSLNDYENVLKQSFPNEHKAIDAIMKDIKAIMTHMDVLYGIENPLFLPKPYDMEYLSKTLLPWMFKFMVHMRKAMRYMEPVDEYLQKITNDQAMVDMISQHFFAKTPTFFALSYFTLYLQYQYPMGSTQKIIETFVNYIQQKDGELLNRCEVISIDSDAKQVKTKDGNVYSFKQLLWAADTNRFYYCLNIEGIKQKRLQIELNAKKNFFASMKGADSIITIDMFTNLEPQYFSTKNGPHAFYTPKLEGISSVPVDTIMENGSFTRDKQTLFEYIKANLSVNTLEISIPSLRDSSLSPKGKSALIVSTLFDYALCEHLVECGYYDEFKKLASQEMICILDEGLWHGLSEHIEMTIVSTPKTIYDRTYATQGSVTGWSFENHPFPVEYKFLSVSKAVHTPIKFIKQAGQFTFNPAGVPVAVLTGKLAADAVHKDLLKENKHDK